MLIRKATLADIPALDALIATSARALSARDYTADQIEAALLGAWGVDSELIRDSTYFIGIDKDGEANGDANGDAAAGNAILCGGWSRRATAFGGDAYTQRESRLLDPRSEPAKIRAFFVHPSWARRGLASRLLALCEAEAKSAGFTTTELTATLPGQPFYAHHGYIPGTRRSYDLPNGTTIDFVPMSRTLA